MIVFMTESIRLNPERVKKKRIEIFGSQPKLVKAWSERFGDAPHQTHISKVERGIKGLSLEKVGQLAELLETNIDYLILRSDDDKPASDLEDQVVFTVYTEKEKRLLKEIGEEYLTLSDADQQLVLDFVSRLPKDKGKPPPPPHIIE